MTILDEPEGRDALTWPRTPEGRCSCPYCSAIRAGALPIPETHSIWEQRVTGALNPLRNADWGDR